MITLADIKDKIQKNVVDRTELDYEDISAISMIDEDAVRIYLVSEELSQKQSMFTIKVEEKKYDIDWQVMKMPTAPPPFSREDKREDEKDTPSDQTSPFKSMGHAVDKGRTDKWETIPPGVSTGHPEISAGTTNFLFKEGFFGSNAHVYAPKGWSKGDVLVQPGVHDGGAPGNDDFGTLVDATIPSNWAVNTIEWDFAFGELDGSREYIAEILDLFVPKGLRNPEIGEKVSKSGRTTAVTRGTVSDRDVDVRVNYGGFRIILVKNCNVYTPAILKGGDSGSAIMADSDQYAVDIGFAGSDSRSLGIGHLPKLFDKFGLELVTEGNGGGGPTEWVPDFTDSLEIPIRGGDGEFFQVVDREIDPEEPYIGQIVVVKTTVAALKDKKKIKLSLYHDDEELAVAERKIDGETVIELEVQAPTSEGNWEIDQTGYFDANE